MVDFAQRQKVTGFVITTFYIYLLCVNRKMLKQDVLLKYHITIFVIISGLASSTVYCGYDPSSGQDKRL
jgi:hypothetical protein